MFQFTHPGRGATSPAWYVSLTLVSFNSRTPGGVRQDTFLISLRDLGRFNSRTPGGVRQSWSLSESERKQSFNSRTPGGVRLGFSRTKFQPMSFNSRTPGGVRLSSHRSFALSCCFNSRTPGGVRQRIRPHLRHTHDVSIHAPREGCDAREDQAGISPTSFK